LNNVLVTNSNSDTEYNYEYVGFTGMVPSAGGADGTAPDLLKYSDPIRSGLAVFKDFQYEMRFTLNGIVTYNWTLTLVNPTDVAYDFVGTANYSANGFGFIGLVCQLITGTATFSEKVVKDIGCCDDVDWSQTGLNTVLNGQGNYLTYATGWFGPGYDGGSGYFDPMWHNTQFDPYPYPNIVGGERYGTVYGTWDLPCQNESPYRPGPALSSHEVWNMTYFDGTNYH
jgi:hypothetical protein